MAPRKSNPEAKEKKFLTYKGKPLVRCGDTIYYGNMNDRFVVKISIKSSSDLQDIKISEKVLVRLISTDSTLDSNKKIIKMSEKNGFYNSLDIAHIWLERALIAQVL